MAACSRRRRPSPTPTAARSSRQRNEGANHMSHEHRLGAGAGSGFSTWPDRGRACVRVLQMALLACVLALPLGKQANASQATNIDDLTKILNKKPGGDS